MAINESGTITLKMLAQDLASGNVGKFIANMDRAAKQGGLLGNTIKGMSMSMGAMLNPAALVAKGIGAVTDVMGASIGAASDQAEALSKVTVVFGDQADEIEAWSKTAATGMGMTKTAALEAAGTLGNLFDGLGLASDAGADMSKKIVQLAADLGSFNNVDTATALDALKSGLLGEAEPMRKFGSALSAARVEAYALSHGLAASKSTISESAKVQARYALILEDTKNAQGDFSRTADGLANSTKTLNSQFGDMEAQLGTTLKNAVMPFLHAIVAIGDQTPNTSNVVGKLTQSYRDLIQQQEFSAKAADQGGTIWDDFVSRGTALVFAQDTAISEFTGTLGKEAQVLGVSRHELALFTEAGLTLGKTIPEIKAVLDGLYKETLGKNIVAAARRWNPLLYGMAGTAHEVGQSIYGGLVHPVKRAMHDMFQTAADAKAPWKAAMKALAEAGKDPFSDKNFATWMKHKAHKLVENARQEFRAGGPDTRKAAAALAYVMTNPILVSLAHTQEEIQKLANAALIMNGVTASLGGFSRNGSSGHEIPGHWKTTKHGTTWIDARMSGDRASGGPVNAGRSYLVGEQGPEVLTMGSGSGNITPNHALGGALHVHFHGMLTAPTEAEADRIADKVGLALERWRRKRGIS